MTGDFTGDGRLDLAVSGYDFADAQSEISVLLGNGDGTFQIPQQTATGVDPECRGDW